MTIRMKKIIKITLVSVAFLLFAVSQSCKKAELDPEYTFTVVVKTLSDSTRVSNVNVEILAPVPNSRVKLLGATDQEGEVTFKYNKEATLLIRATRGERGNYTWIGCNYIRLLAEEVALQTVYIRPYDPEIEGC